MKQVLCQQSMRHPVDIPIKKGVINLTRVAIKPNESPEELLRRFRKKVMRSGRLATVRQKRWFVSKSEVRRIEKKKAIRRIKRRQRTPR
jgi:small subunit ribosomal protein S21